MRRIIGTVALVVLWLLAGQPTDRGLAADVTGTSFVNANFDSGPGVGWTEYSQQGFGVVTHQNDLAEGITARSKFYVAWLGGYDREQAWVNQTVTISDATPVLEYWTWIDSTELNCKWDTGYVYVAGRAVSATGLCVGNNTGGWSRRSIDLSVFAGQTVPVQFAFTSDASYVSSQYIDDVVLIANPLPRLVVRAAKNGALVHLSWQHNASYTGYEVWRSLDPYFVIGETGSEPRGNIPPPSTTAATYDDAGATGNWSANYYYLVRGSGTGMTRTFNRTGEFDFPLVAGASGLQSQ